MPTKDKNNNLMQHSHDEFLKLVGDRVRGIRAKRGMSRRLLSDQSEVSERYLADLEQGKGNISINLLRQVAAALNAHIADLLPTRLNQSPEHTLINDFVSRLSRTQQQSALQQLHLSYTAISTAHTRIAFVGLRGAGKTTLGRMLNDRLRIPFIQLSTEIESLADKSVSEILSSSGQSGYRRLEEAALMKAFEEADVCCIETGGSIVSEIKGLNLLLTNCIVVWVKTTPEEHMSRVIKQGDMRPMQENGYAMEDLHAILAERSPYYEQAQIHLDTSNKTVDESYDELIALLKEKNRLSANLLATQ